MTYLRTFLAALSLAAALASSPALAEEDLIEKVVVRNRLFQLAGKTEIGANVGFSLLARLTDHINFNAHVTRHLSETIAIEGRVGYAYSRHTGLARQIAFEFMQQGMSTVTDLKDLWEMNVNGSLGVRWAPIYGKLSLMEDLPVHFQAYLWLGAGAGQFRRQSITICNMRTAGECVDAEGRDAYYTQSKVSPLGSAAIGLRFFISRSHSVKVELRDYSYPDSYLENVDRDLALDPATPEGGGTPARNPGLSNLVQADLGYSFIF